MKTIFALMLLVTSISVSFAEENQASDCSRTLHSDERESKIVAEKKKEAEKKDGVSQQ